MTPPTVPGRPGVRSFDELMDRQAEAALALSGADHSSWRRGRLGPTRTVDNGIVLGTADWDGTLRYHHDEVVKPLQEMFARQGQQLDAATLVRYRSALLVVLHENAHMLAPAGRDNGDERDTPLSPDAARSALEEGATEAWAVRNLDRYIDELGLEQVAPGIKSVTEVPRYQHYLPAVDVLTERIGDQSGVTRDEILRRMNCALSDGKWPVAVDLMYESSELPELVPPEDMRRVKREIDQAMRTPFRSLAALATRMPIANRRRESAALGEAAFFEGLRAVARLENTYRTGSAPSLQRERSTEQPAPSSRPTKDVVDVAFSGTAPATNAVHHRPTRTTLNRPTSTSPPHHGPQPHTRDTR
ncbi:hypothetical protein [Kribbella swartbergensis]